MAQDEESSNTSNPKSAEETSPPLAEAAVDGAPAEKGANGGTNEKSTESKMDTSDSDEKGVGNAKKRSRSSETKEDAAPTTSGREKRVRKSTERLEVEDFLHVDTSPQVIEGKGTRLSDIPKVVETIEGYKDNAEELQMAYRFIFATRGKVNNKEIKSTLLSFSGYLPKPADGVKQEEIEKIEQAAEKKYATKAYKLHVPQLKKLCDVFAVDRSGVNDKDSLVETLLDFLSVPDEKLTKGAGKKAATKKSTASKSKSAEDKTLDDYEEVVEGVEPTDQQLRQWVRAYVRCFNTAKVTLKDAVKIAEDKFGVDLSEKKKRLKELLTEEI